MNIVRINKFIAQGYVIDNKGSLVHRKICRQAHGPYPKDWIVHHIDHNKSNNDSMNLIALPRKLHDRLHSVMRKQKRILTRVELEQALYCWKKELVVKMHSG